MPVESLEGLPEEVASLYKKGEDGKFHLDSGDGLKSALQKERERANAAEKALKAREHAEEDMKRKADEDLALKRGEFDKVRAQDQEELRKERESSAALKKLLMNGALERAAMEAITANKGIPKALLPHVTEALEVVPDGDGFKVVVKANPGQKLTDYVSGLKADMAWGFEGAGASGGGAGQPGNGGNNSAKTITRSSFDNLSPAAKHAHVKAGGKVTD